MNPQKTTKDFVQVGINKAKMGPLKTFVLAIFAGAFIALAGVASTIALATSGKLAAAAVFPIGLIFVIFFGAELFTGNCLMPIALLKKKITAFNILENWLIVLLGNTVGAILVAFLAVHTGTLDVFKDTILATANAKVDLSFAAAFWRGAFCNFLVCLAVWLAKGIENTGAKMLAIFMPVFLFVFCGFEHSIANIFYIPAGIFFCSTEVLNWWTFLGNNFIPVLLGNIVGGACFLALPLYFLHLHKEKKNG